MSKHHDPFPQQGRILQRFNRELAHHDQKVARIVQEAGPVEQPATVHHATLPGDRRRLRGIPVAGGACGTSPGTDPLQALLWAER